jgi:hypothetical protein
LAVEALEERLVPSTNATQIGSTLFINADPGFAFNVREILLQVDQNDHSKLDVTDVGPFRQGWLLGQFTISSIQTVDVHFTANDALTVDDSNGFPLAFNTNVVLGGGHDNSLVLRGSQPIQGFEAFWAGTATQLGILVSGGSVFRFSNAITSVLDELPINTPVGVEAFGQAITLSDSVGGTEALSGLASGGGGNTFAFANKGNVALELLSDNASADLNAQAAATGLKDILVSTHRPNDTVNIDTTPSSVTTDVEMEGLHDQVNLRANSGQVNIDCYVDAQVTVGSNPSSFSQSVTSGINANVSVFGALTLSILDGGNATTKEQVKVTESTIAGTGLFGNNNVVLTYGGIGSPVTIFTGQLANTYTVTGSQPGAHFSSAITIEDLFSSAGLSVVADLDSGSGLVLDLFNKNPAAGHLFISAPGGKINPQTPTTPNGAEVVTFTGGLTSTVAYTGFNNVSHS